MINILQKTVFLLALIGAINITLLAQTAAETVCLDYKSQENSKVKAKSEKKALIDLASTVALVNQQSDFALLQTDEPPVEKSIAVEPKSSVSFCVALGDVEVRGWQRNEVRVLVEGGKVGFKISSRHPETNNPVALHILGFEPKHGAPYQNECLKAERVTVEVPYTAYVGIKTPGGSGGNVSVDSVWKTMISSDVNDVQIRNVSYSAEVSTSSGNILAEDSSGSFRFKSFEGDIMAVRMRPNEFSDMLKLENISGNIMLRDVTHKSIEARAANGDISALNSLVSGGNYDFNSSTGSVLLQLPNDFPFQIKATMSATGNFKSDFAIKFTTQGTGGARFITGSNGAGDTSINLITSTGVLYLKQKPQNK